MGMCAGASCASDVRRLAHAVVILSGVPVWFFAVGGFAIILFLSRLAERILPGDYLGNCWSFTMPRWYESGGYLAIRWAKGPVRFFGMRIPHAVWVKELPENTELQHTIPRRRSSSRVLPNVVYFPFTISRSDK